MSWVLLDDNFPNHPKTLKAGPLAAWLYVCGLAYCRRYNTNGFVPTAVVKTLIATNVSRPIAALVDVGLWERDAGGYRVHDYGQFYGDEAILKAEKDERRRKKQTAGRLGGQASWAKRSIQDAVAEANAEADAEAHVSAQPKHGASTGAEALRGTGSGSGPVLVMDSEKKEMSPPLDVPLDAWFRDLLQLYPKQAVSSGYLTENAWFHTFTEDLRPAREIWAEMQANLDNQKRGYQWRVKSMIPKLERWLREGLWRQQHDPDPPTAEQLTSRTSRTLNAVSSILQEPE